MTVALDATVGGPSANSYVVSVAEATTLLDASPYLAAWIARADEDDDSVNTQTRLLLRAMRVLESLTYAGYTTYNLQALLHPRDAMPSPDGWDWDPNVIALPMKQAQADIAGYLASRTETDPLVRDESSLIEAVKVGPIELTMRSVGSSRIGTDAPASAFDDFLDRIILPQLAAKGLLGSSSSVRLTR